MRALICLGFALFWCAEVRCQADAAAAQAVALGHWQVAKTAAAEAIKRNPRDANAWSYLGISCGELGEHEAALHAFEKAVELEPSSKLTHNNYGAALEAAGRTEQAATQYRQSLALDPNQPAPLVNLARMLAARGMKDRLEMHALLVRAWEIAPDEEIARSLLMLSACASTDRRAASPEQAVGSFAAFEAEHGGQAPVNEVRAAGTALQACGYPEKAQQFYGEVLRTHPQNVSSIVGLAEVELTQGKARAAGMRLESALAQGLQSPDVYATLARVYQQTGYKDHALDALQRALALDPQSAALQFAYGMLLLELPAPRAAQLRMEQAVEAHPQSSRLHFVLGLSLFDQTEPEQAAVEFHRSAELDQHFAPALAYSGLAALDMQHYTEAERWYRLAITVAPDTGDYYLLLSEALEREHPENTEPAQVALNKAVSLDPALALAYVHLGRIDFAAGRYTEAAAELQKALALDPKQVTAHFYLARTYSRLHEPELAARESGLFAKQNEDEQAADRRATQDAVRQVGGMTF